MQKSCRSQLENVRYAKIFIDFLISVGYKLSLKNNAGIKSPYSTAQPSMKFTKFNHFEPNFNNLLILKTLFKYERKFNILNPGYAVS